MPSPPTSVVVHPLVLLSCVDHYNRVARVTNKRVVGVLLGEWSKGKVDVTNSYAVPFEEDPKDANIWFLDHNFHENMYEMFKKVNAREQVIGWYSTGPKIKPADLEINELFRRYTPNPLLVIISVQPQQDQLGIPTEAYCSIEEASADGSLHKTFVHIPSEIGAYEAEEVGVEHLLRDIKDTSSSTLANRVSEKIASLKGLINKLSEMKEYLENVVSGRLPANPQIIYNMQDMFNLLPNLNVEELVRSFAIKTNDMMLVIYLCSMIRSVIALHNLINNKLHNRELERGPAKPAVKAAEAGEKKEGDKKEADKKESAKKSNK